MFLSWRKAETIAEKLRNAVLFGVWYSNTCRNDRDFTRKERAEKIRHRRLKDVLYSYRGYIPFRVFGIRSS